MREMNGSGSRSSRVNPIGFNTFRSGHFGMYQLLSIFFLVWVDGASPIYAAHDLRVDNVI
jgi:hypothetical protein